MMTRFSDVAQFAVCLLARGAQDIERGVVGDVAGFHEDADRGADAPPGHQRNATSRSAIFARSRTALGVELDDDFAVDVALPVKRGDRLSVGQVLTFELLGALLRFDIVVIMVAMCAILPATVRTA